MVRPPPSEGPASLKARTPDGVQWEPIMDRILVQGAKSAAVGRAVLSVELDGIAASLGRPRIKAIITRGYSIVHY